MERFKLKRLADIKDWRGTNVVLAFTVLRFIATCLITNTHYNDVYPIKALAVGGLLGDVLFFIVSGFVLARPTKQKFLPWYGKRILRIYPTIIAGVVIYILTGYQTLLDYSWFEAFIFPTFFLFTAAIILLYIPFYFVNKIVNKKSFLLVFGGWIVLWILVYLFAFDKSVYRMNSTGSPMIAFPYFTGMLFGAYLRKFAKNKSNVLSAVISLCISIVFMTAYFAATKMVRGNEALYPVQIFVQITLLISLMLFVYAVYHMEGWFRKWPEWLLTAINFVAGLTLEIYVIQKPIIKAMASIAFPVNWILITAAIIASALCLRIVMNFIISCVELGIEKLKVRKG